MLSQTATFANITSIPRGTTIAIPILSRIELMAEATFQLSMQVVSLECVPLGELGVVAQETEVIALPIEARPHGSPRHSWAKQGG